MKTHNRTVCTLIAACVLIRTKPVAQTSLSTKTAFKTMFTYRVGRPNFNRLNADRNRYVPDGGSNYRRSWYGYRFFVIENAWVLELCDYLNSKKKSEGQTLRKHVHAIYRDFFSCKN